MPYLSLAKRGYTSQFDLVEVVNAILYKLKSGCQWRLLPMAIFLLENLRLSLLFSNITGSGVRK
ncbi:MAG: transposase [Bacteroides sp.]|nr:transposase [Bacteroides sp.]